MTYIGELISIGVAFSWTATALLSEFGSKRLLTLQDKASGLYLTASKNSKARLSAIATPVRIQQIDIKQPNCYSLLGPFSTGYQHLMPIATELEGIAYSAQCGEGGNDPALYLNITESAEKHMKGDVNEDGKVDINDVVAVINHMAGTISWRYANVNEDAEEAVDINDVVAIINIMAGK